MGNEHPIGEPETIKALVISDLHLEFLDEKRRRNRLEGLPKDVDIAIIAGDIDNINLEESLKYFADSYKFVLYTPGNHEYWGGSAIDRHEAIKSITSKFPNIILLDRYRELNQVFEYKGHRFLGSTLWFRKTVRADINKMSWIDFHAAKGLNDLVWDWNQEAVVYLTENVKKGDIVITHHLPTNKSTPPYFKNEQSQDYFVCDMENLIVHREPALWIHGHTHGAADYMFEHTRILCRPHGYPSEKSEVSSSNFMKESVFEL